MPVINILSPHMADLIAAGEVVERPASVVKELLENSFDAGAKNVTVELRGGGMTYIRVTDDGCGMAPEDAGVAFLRHATSKLSDERGLEAIGTMGFRGEALAAIAAVSRVELLTRRRGDSSGTRVCLDAGEITEMSPCGCPEGTTMVIRDLFYNTPARLKFMKTDKAEASACINNALRCALGRPEVSVRCVRDGKDEFFSPGDGRADSCIYSLLGREFASGLLECRTEDGAVSVRGYISSPAAGRGNRAHQFFFCNGRYIRSATLQTALERAYKNTLLTGKFPSCVLYIDLSFASVDVNVHPTKLEVKFTDERKVFDGVYYAALAALEKERQPVQMSLSPKAQPKKDFFRQMTAEEFRTSSMVSGKSSPSAKPAAAAKPTFAPSHPAVPTQKADIIIKRESPAAGSSLRNPGFAYGKSPAAPVPPREEAKPAPAPIAKPAPAPETEKPAAPSPELPLMPETPVRVIGETMGTYILAETEDGLVLIDKHAAHERIIFDRLKAESQEIMSQSLLIPVIFTADAGDCELLLKNAETLAGMGFEIDEYGDKALAVRALPADMDIAETQSALEELCEKLNAGGADAADLRDALLHTIACKAAIKAGRSSDPGELHALVKAVVSGQVKYCPHGRPVSVTLTKKELDRQFKRIV